MTWNLARRLLEKGIDVGVVVVATDLAEGLRRVDRDGLSVYEIPNVLRELVLADALSDRPGRALAARRRRSRQPTTSGPMSFTSTASIRCPLVLLEAWLSPRWITVREFCFGEDLCLRETLLLPERAAPCSGPESVWKCLSCYFRRLPRAATRERAAKAAFVPLAIAQQALRLSDSTEAECMNGLSLRRVPPFRHPLPPVKRSAVIPQWRRPPTWRPPYYRWRPWNAVAIQLRRDPSSRQGRGHGLDSVWQNRRVQRPPFSFNLFGPLVGRI